MSNQPAWKLIAQLGDANPLEYGGFYVYEDATGVYAPEAELLVVPEDETEPRKVYRFSLDRCKVKRGYLIPASYQASWPHPVPKYEEWFAKSLEAVSDCMDYPGIRSDLCNPNPIARARAYRAIGEYHGFENLDSYPFTLTAEETEKRYE